MYLNSHKLFVSWLWSTSRKPISNVPFLLFILVIQGKWLTKHCSLWLCPAPWSLGIHVGVPDCKVSMVVMVHTSGWCEEKGKFLYCTLCIECRGKRDAKSLHLSADYRVCSTRWNSFRLSAHLITFKERILSLLKKGKRSVCNKTWLYLNRFTEGLISLLL